MRSLLARVLLIPFIALLASYSYAAEKFTLDPQHSYVRWEVSHFGFSSPSGKWLANGTLDLDEKDPAKSKVEVTIDVENIITGIPDLDKHLRGALFFNTEKYPIATFVSDEVEVTGKDTAKVKGNLTLRGVTKPVTLDVKLNKYGKNPINDKDTAGFSATTTLKRSDFGIKTLLPGLGDKVKLAIEVEAFKSEINKVEDAPKKHS